MWRHRLAVIACDAEQLLSALDAWMLEPECAHRDVYTGDTDLRRTLQVFSRRHGIAIETLVAA